MASSTRKAAWVGGLILLLLVLPPLDLTTRVAFAAELLTNGGFEQGSSGWSGPGLSTSGCVARSGSGAATLTTSTDGPQAWAQRSINGSFAQDRYVLTAYARAASGSAELSLEIIWYEGMTAGVPVASEPFQLSASWFRYEIEDARSISSATRAVVRIKALEDGAASVCLDDVSFEGPALLTPTSTPTLAPTPTQMPTAPESTETPTPTPTDTPTAPASTETPTPTPSDTPTTTPTSTPTAAVAAGTPPTVPTPAPLAFVNGDFEQGIRGWQKYGGELRDVSSPRRGGAGAGAFVSTTASTKWAFQTVRIESDTVYEFQGYVQPGAGVVESYLRISWYGSLDGSGTALATDDSTARAPGGSAAFIHLTTGPRTPPRNARSARLRVMLAPAGAATATVYLDDFSFGIAPPSAALPPPPSTGVAADDPPEVVEALPASSPPAAAPSASGPAGLMSATAVSPIATATPTPALDVLALRDAPPSPTPPPFESPPVETPPATDAGPGTLETLLAAVGVLVITLGGSYLLARRRGS